MWISRKKYNSLIQSIQDIQDAQKNRFNALDNAVQALNRNDQTLDEKIVHVNNRVTEIERREACRTLMEGDAHVGNDNNIDHHFGYFIDCSNGSAESD